MPDVVAALKAQRRRQNEDRLSIGPGWQDMEGLVFTTGVGSPVDAHNARRTLRWLLKHADLPQDRPWHTMRHSLATRLLNRGVPMPVVSQIIGHASIRTTVDIYGHAEPAINAQALAEALPSDPRHAVRSVSLPVRAAGHCGDWSGRARASGPSPTGWESP